MCFDGAVEQDMMTALACLDTFFLAEPVGRRIVAADMRHLRELAEPGLRR